MKKLLSLSLLIIGAACYAGSLYIEKEVLHGQSQINSAQKKVKQADSLFSISPYTEPLGKSITGSAKEKIQEGQDQVDYYTQLAAQLKIGGMIGMGLGALLLLLSFRRKS